MTNFCRGDRVRIIGFGPNDSWSRAVAENETSPLNATGYLVDVDIAPLATPGYTTCIIKLDEPFANYMHQLTLFEVLLEKLEPLPECDLVCPKRRKTDRKDSPDA